MFPGGDLQQQQSRASSPSHQPRSGEKAEERRLINVEEQIEFVTMALPKGLLNFISENNPDAIKACPFWPQPEDARDWAGIVGYIKKQEIQTSRFYGDDEEKRRPIRETLAVLQDRLKTVSKAEALKTLMTEIKELQLELNKPLEPLPPFLLESYLVAYQAWVAATAINQPYLLEQHVGFGGGNNGHG